MVDLRHVRRSFTLHARTLHACEAASPASGGKTIVAYSCHQRHGSEVACTIAQVLSAASQWRRGRAARRRRYPATIAAARLARGM